MTWFSGLSPVIQALIASIFTWLVTLLGALTVFFFKCINKKVLSIVLGFSAGVMLAASFWSLLIPAIDLSSKLNYIKWLIPSLGFIFGGLFVLLSDKFLDKVMVNSNVFCKKNLLLIIAITMHNIPEGMAIGVAFGGVGLNSLGVSLIGAVMLALGIGIQNFPEGAAVSLPLRSSGMSRFKSFMIGQASAIVEPIFAVIGALLVLFVQSLMPFLLSFAAGAMIIVVARELLPESVSGDKNLSTFGLIIGFIIMMVLDVALG